MFCHQLESPCPYLYAHNILADCSFETVGSNLFVPDMPLMLF